MGADDENDAIYPRTEQVPPMTRASPALAFVSRLTAVAVLQKDAQGRVATKKVDGVDAKLDRAKTRSRQAS